MLLPGDNEWTDCRRTFGSSYDPLERMQKLRELFFSGDAALGQRPLALVRQPAATRGAHDYPEHARWEHGGVLFLTLNAPGPDNNARAHPEEYSRRLPALTDWIARGFRLRAEPQRKSGRGGDARQPMEFASCVRGGASAKLLATLAAETRAFNGRGAAPARRHPPATGLTSPCARSGTAPPSPTSPASKCSAIP